MNECLEHEGAEGLGQADTKIVVICHILMNACVAHEDAEIPGLASRVVVIT